MAGDHITQPQRQRQHHHHQLSIRQKINQQTRRLQDPDIHMQTTHMVTGVGASCEVVGEALILALGDVEDLGIRSTEDEADNEAGSVVVVEA